MPVRPRCAKRRIQARIKDLSTGPATDAPQATSPIQGVCANNIWCAVQMVCCPLSEPNRNWLFRNFTFNFCGRAILTLPRQRQDSHFTPRTKDDKIPASKSTLLADWAGINWECDFFRKGRPMASFRIFGPYYLDLGDPGLAPGEAQATYWFGWQPQPTSFTVTVTAHPSTLLPGGSGSEHASQALQVSETS